MQNIANSREADHGVRQILKLQQLNNVLDISILLHDRDVLWLPEVRRELESLPHSCRPLVCILTPGQRKAFSSGYTIYLLFGVRAASLKVLSDFAPIETDLAADYTDILSVRQDIKQSGLSIPFQYDRRFHKELTHLSGS